jgi:hypothetical protein
VNKISEMDKLNAEMALWEQNPREVRAFNAQYEQDIPIVLAMATATGSVSGLNPMSCAHWCDISHWTDGLDLYDLLTNHRFDGSMPKAADGAQMYPGDAYDLGNYVDHTFPGFVDQTYHARKGCIPYFFFQPKYFQASTPESDWQYKRLKYAFNNKIPGKSFHALAIDLEVGGDSDVNTVNKLKRFFGWLLSDPQFNTVPIIWYTSMGYLGQHPAIANWFGAKESPVELWMAQWSHSHVAHGPIPIDQMDAHMAAVNMRVMLPGNNSKRRFVQWTDAIEVGKQGVDGNFYFGTVEECYTWLGVDTAPLPPPPPPPAPEPVTMTIDNPWSDRINLRSAPIVSTETLKGQLHDGTQVEVLEEKVVGGDVFIRVRAEGWIAKRYQGRNYIGGK